MYYYQISFEEELRHIERAIAYYNEWGTEVRSPKYEWDYLRTYYSGYTAKAATIQFRALFFAMRLQPVLSYIETFIRENQRAPHILDLGCGFGTETLLLGLYGAKVYGIDISKGKVEVAHQIKQNMEQTHDTPLDVEFEAVNLFRFAPPTTYDAVYSSATLHHIEPAPEAFVKISSLINKGGHFFLSDENGYSPVQQLAVQKRIGFTKPRKYLMTDKDTGEQFVYGNENIRPASLWTRYMQNAYLTPISIKYCRFLPPLNWSLLRLVSAERALRSIPGLTEIAAIGFLLTAQKI